MLFLTLCGLEYCGCSLEARGRMGLRSRDLSGRGCWHSRHLNIYFILGGVLFSSIPNSQRLCGGVSLTGPIPSELKPPSCSPDCQAASAALSWLFLQAPGSGFPGFFFSHLPFSSLLTQFSPPPFIDSSFPSLSLSPALFVFSFLYFALQMILFRVSVFFG